MIQSVPIIKLGCDLQRRLAQRHKNAAFAMITCLIYEEFCRTGSCHEMGKPFTSNNLKR